MVPFLPTFTTLVSRMAGPFCKELVGCAQKLGRKERFGDQSLNFTKRSNAIENIRATGSVDYRNQRELLAHQPGDGNSVMLA